MEILQSLRTEDEGGISVTDVVGISVVVGLGGWISINPILLCKEIHAWPQPAMIRESAPIILPILPE